MSSLDNLRKAAKRWLKALRAGDASAAERLRRLNPKAPGNPGLRDIQRALALERGFESWIALKNSLSAGDVLHPGTALEALLDAAGKGDTARVAGILDDYPDIVSSAGDLAGNDGHRTALHFAIKHEPVVHLLLERGADPNVRDSGDNAMPLHFAAEDQNFEIIKLLVEHGADPIGAGDMHELDVIGWASCWDYREANRQIVDYLLAHGAKHHIFSAVTLGEVDVVRQLVADAPEAISRRMDRTNKRRTPLHQAVVKGQPEAAAVLIELGAELEALDAAGLTPLDQAALEGKRDLAQLLIDRGAVVRVPAAVALGRLKDLERLMRDDTDAVKPGHRFGTLIVQAARNASGDVVSKLIELGASVNAVDDESTSIDQTRGYTPLHASAFHGNEQAVRVLLKHGADVNAREDKYGSTPAGWANYAGHRHLRDLILRGPIDMFQAIDFGVTERIPQLLKQDPDAVRRKFRGVSPLAWAAMAHNFEAAKFLVGEGAALELTPKQKSRLARNETYHAVLKLLEARTGKGKGAAVDPRDDRVSTFLEFATWDHHVHGKGDHRMCDRAAARLLAQHPEIERHSLFTAIVCGNVDEVVRIVAERPGIVRERGGPRDWTPLLYLCYTRYSHAPAIENAVRIATALLDAGANPNDYYMAGHARYSTLVGVAREGEQDAPPHPRREELFKLLLERGANMYDIQVLYNTHFSGDVLWWLKLVYSHAVSVGRTADWNDPDWPMFDMGGYGCGARFLLTIAIRKNDLELAEWLLTHGASPNAPAPKSPGLSPHNLYEEALRAGATEIADLLGRYGATTTVKSTEDEGSFVAACMRLDRNRVHELLAAHPEYRRSPAAMFEAAARDRVDVLRFLVDLGFSVDMRDSHNTRPLHHAASENALAAAQWLIDLGAEIDPQESRFGATPIGWAAHGDRTAMVDLLSRYSRNVWTLSSRGYVDRLREVLRADPSLARAVSSSGVTPLWWLPDDDDQAVAIVNLFLAHGADPATRSKEGTTAADWAAKRGMTRVAARLSREDGDHEV